MHCYKYLDLKVYGLRRIEILDRGSDIYMNRKIFLFISGLIFSGIFVGCALVFRQDSQQENKKSKQDTHAEDVCTKQLFAMDTYMDFTAYGENSEKAVDAAIAQVEKLDALLSTGEESSEIFVLNRKGSLEVSADTGAIFFKAQDIYEKTEGLFDYTIYPIMELWGFPSGEYHVASEKELEQVLPLVDASRVEITRMDEMDGADSENNAEGSSAEEDLAGEEKKGAFITLGKGQKADFGGIAKGYTAMKVMDIFREYGITSGQVTLGGNVQVLNVKPDGTKWNVGIRDPEGGQSDPIAVVPVDNKAVVTSGGYERYFEENGKTYIHIIDPRTGYPVEGDLLSVSVIAEDGTLADALSTSLYIMGKEGACAYWKEHKEEFDMVLITDEKELYVTEGIADGFRSEKDYTVVKR